MSLIKVKTFTNALKVLHTIEELHALDDQVNRYIQDNNVEKVISVSDSLTTGDGNTIGIIRILTYKTAK